MRALVERGASAAMAAKGRDVPERPADDPVLVQSFRKALSSVASGRSQGDRPAGGVTSPGEDDPGAHSGEQAGPVSLPWPPVSLPAPHFAPLSAATPSGGTGDIGLPMPAAAIVAALDHLHAPMLPQASGAGPGGSAWHVTLPGNASFQAALPPGGGASSGWRVRVLAEGALRQATRPHLEGLRQRLQARGASLDECILGEDE